MTESAGPTSADPRASDAPLAGYELLVCLTGGIACYKVATVVSALVQRGCGVTVAMTRNARRFITPLTFQALTGREVHVDPWRFAAGDIGIQHLRLSERADLLLLAPATANTIGKLACGIADNLVGALLIGAACPAIIAPAMNTRMWEHPAVRRNVEFLRDAGYEIVDPETGWMACRAVGVGRMVEAGGLIERVEARLRSIPPRSAASNH
ncbi:MAG: Coenzyme A biosynthesis bifunctional protein CoaBC [Phycisphaerae bacterium]|nr:Coenzyme A biosynthesis bifunctional protein CoaBC [Phycisphaerae bacterium]